jgi:hypothetical protein
MLLQTLCVEMNICNDRKDKKCFKHRYDVRFALYFLLQQRSQEIMLWVSVDMQGDTHVNIAKPLTGWFSNSSIGEAIARLLGSCLWQPVPTHPPFPSALRTKHCICWMPCIFHIIKNWQYMESVRRNLHIICPASLWPSMITSHNLLNSR